MVEMNAYSGHVFGTHQRSASLSSSDTAATTASYGFNRNLFDPFQPACSFNSSSNHRLDGASLDGNVSTLTSLSTPFVNITYSAPIGNSVSTPPTPHLFGSPPNSHAPLFRPSPASLFGKAAAPPSSSIFTSSSTTTTTAANTTNYTQVTPGSSTTSSVSFPLCSTSPQFGCGFAPHPLGSTSPQFGCGFAPHSNAKNVFSTFSTTCTPAVLPVNFDYSRTPLHNFTKFPSSQSYQPANPSSWSTATTEKLPIGGQPPKPMPTLQVCPSCGHTSFWAQQRGVGVAEMAYSPTSAPYLLPFGMLNSISAMPIYNGKSHEKLRLEDYQQQGKAKEREICGVTGAKSVVLWAIPVVILPEMPMPMAMALGVLPL